MQNNKNKQSTSIEYRVTIPPHRDYSNPEGRYWLLEDGSKVSKGDKKNHTFDMSKYEVKHFVHNFQKFSANVLKQGITLSTYMVSRLDAPGYYYTICPKNYLYDHLGVLTESILWQKPQFSYLDILKMFSLEIKAYLNEDKNNICIMEKGFSKYSSTNDKYFRYKHEKYVILSDSDSEKDIMHALEEHTEQEGEGIIVLGNVENVNTYLQNGQIIDKKFFDEVSKNSFRLYYPIYDNESFMVWETPPLLRMFTRLHIEASDIDKIIIRQHEGDLINVRPLPLPDFLIIEKDIQPGEPGFMLYRFTNEAKFSGDTWHQSLKEAKLQAEYEYGEAVGRWEEIPKDVESPLKYVIDINKKN